MPEPQEYQLHGLSPLGQTHQLLVGQRLDGWPQVQVLDEHQVLVKAVLVRYAVSGAASFRDAGDTLDIESNNWGHAIPTGLYGERPGTANVQVTLPGSPGSATLEYSVEVS